MKQYKFFNTESHGVIIHGVSRSFYIILRETPCNKLL